MTVTFMFGCSMVFGMPHTCRWRSNRCNGNRPSLHFTAFFFFNFTKKNGERVVCIDTNTRNIYRLLSILQCVSWLLSYCRAHCVCFAFLDWTWNWSSRPQRTRICVRFFLSTFFVSLVRMHKHYFVFNVTSAAALAVAATACSIYSMHTYVRVKL